MAKRNITSDVDILKRTEDSSSETIDSFIAERLKNQRDNAVNYAFPADHLDDHTKAIATLNGSQNIPHRDLLDASDADDHDLVGSRLFPESSSVIKSIASNRSGRSPGKQLEKNPTQPGDLDQYFQEFFLGQDTGDIPVIQIKISSTAHNLMSMISKYSRHKKRPLSINRVLEIVLNAHIELHRNALKEMVAEVDLIHQNTAPKL